MGQGLSRVSDGSSFVIAPLNPSVKWGGPSSPVIQVGELPNPEPVGVGVTFTPGSLTSEPLLLPLEGVNERLWRHVPMSRGRCRGKSPEA